VSFNSYFYFVNNSLYNRFIIKEGVIVMINKDKNRKKSRQFTRVISLCLTLVMCFSVIIPTYVYAGIVEDVQSFVTGVATGAAIGNGAGALKKAGFANMDGGGTVRIKKNSVGSKTNTGYNNILNEQQGYKISVWYAPMDEEATRANNGDPVYYWGTETEENRAFQIGKTIYWKRLYLKTNSGQAVSTDFYNTDSIYSQTTLGYDYTHGLNTVSSGTSDFIYLPTEYIYTPGATATTDFYKNSLEIIKPFFSLLPFDKPIAQWSDGDLGLYDWIARIYNMNDVSKVDFSKINPQTMEYSGELGEILKTKDDYQVPYAAATKSKITGAIKDVEYIKSYFLNPNILNQIAYSSRPDWYDKYNCGVWQPYDFVLGTLNYIQKDGSVESFERGQYKIFIEPVMFRNLPKKIGVMSWRDMMLEHEAKGGTWDCGSVVGNIAVALPEVANALKLSEVDNSLVDKRTGKFLELSQDIPDENSVAPTAKNTANGLGIGVLSSPSLNSYSKLPNVIKTYVEIDSIDANGNVTFKKSAPTTVEEATFIFGMNIPGFNQSEIINGEDGIKKAVLNDVITLDGNLDINEDSEWVNSQLPEGLIDSRDGSIKNIRPSAEDIAGYIFGAIVSSEIDIESMVKVLGIGATYDLDKLVTEIQNYIMTGDYSGVSSVTYYFESLGYDKLSVNVIANAVEYYYNTDVLLGKKSEDNEFVRYEDEDFDNSHTALPGTLVLRYVTVDLPTQYNYVEVRNKNTGALINKYKSMNLLEVIGSDVNVKDPEIRDVRGTPILKEWVTNVETDIPDISDGNLPEVSPNGKESTPGAPEMHIPDYPNEPVTHNLYAKWVIEIDPDEPEDEEEPDPSRLRNSTLRETVPEWRLSKFWKAYEEVKPHSFTMSLLLNTGHCNIHGLSPVGIWNYNVVNPSGTESKKVYSWIHGESKRLQTTHSISKANPSVIGRISGNVNAIKSTDTSNLRAASWIGVNSHRGLLNYDIQSASKGLAFSQDRYVKDTRFSFKVINTDTYTNSYAVVAHYHLYSHCHNTNYKYITPTGASYGYLELISNITFDRYNQVNTDSRLLSINPDIKSNNGLTTLKYQDSDVLNVYPEYGMLFANDEGRESIKWVVGDQVRKIQPVVYQTMEHKVYVKPTSTGNMATDNRARTSLNKVVQGDNTANGKQVLYKGGPVNTTFQMFRDSGATNKGILTVKTFALDIKTNSNDVNVKNEWGNGNYNAKQSHTSLLNAIDNVGKANVSEKLLVDSPIGNSYDRVVDYTGAIKSLTSDKYNRVKYKAGSVGGSLEDNGTVTVFEHELVVRGGQVIGVYLMNRSSGNQTLTSISDLKNRDVALYNALLNMNLYNEENDKSQTVLSTFEHKTGDTLTEPSYASMLQTARQEVDKDRRIPSISLATPDNAKVFENEGWYSEDTTVLVVKEYVTNYEVPSISLSDKLSMSVKGLDTPIDKNQFFSVLGKGYTYLKYDLPLTVPNPKGGNFNTNSYFETTSLPNDGLDSFGYQGVDYLVPNVSISDTTRMN